MDDSPKIQFEAAWSLTNVASGSSEQTRFVVNSGAVPIFIRLLLSPSIEVCDQAVWALGNIAGDGAECRDFLISLGIIQPLLEIVKVCLGNPVARTALLRNVTWTLSNMCRGKPAPNFENVAPILNALPTLFSSNDHDVCVDALWAISHMTDSELAIDPVLRSGLLATLSAALAVPDHLIIIPALRALGNIVSGTNEQTQAVISSGVLPSLKKLLSHPRKGIQKEVCWMISNITAGTREQIGVVISSEIIPEVISLMDRAAFDVKKECCWAICNAAINGAPEQVHYLVSQNCIPPMCSFLNSVDHRVVIAVLEALDGVLRAGAQLAVEKNGEVFICHVLCLTFSFFFLFLGIIESILHQGGRS